MATLKAQDFELEFAYYNLNEWNEIEYLFGIKLNGMPFINPDIIYKPTPCVENGKFIVSDCWDDMDWLHIFFIDILKTKKGRVIQTLEAPEWCFKTITWEDKREEKENAWKDKTVKTENENGETIDIPYSEAMNQFIPLWENEIEFIIEFPSYVFEASGYTRFKLSLTTTFIDLANFLEDFGKEMRRFYAFFDDRIEYLGNGRYQEKDDFDDRLTSLDKDVYTIKRCAEWNNQSIEPEINIIFRLLLNDVRWRGFCIVGTVRYILDSTISENLAKDLFALADKESHNEKENEIRERLTAVKTSIAVAFPNSLSNDERNDALSSIKKEDIPEEIFDKNKLIYSQYLENSANAK